MLRHMELCHNILYVTIIVIDIPTTQQVSSASEALQDPT